MRSFWWTFGVPFIPPLATQAYASRYHKRARTRAIVDMILMFIKF